MTNIACIYPHFHNRANIISKFVLRHHIAAQLIVANKKQSSPKEARKASKALSNPNTSKLTKSLAGSVLSQSRGKKNKKK
jgi:hypothetical protein